MAFRRLCSVLRRRVHVLIAMVSLVGGIGTSLRLATAGLPVPDLHLDVVATDLDSIWVFLGDGKGGFEVPIEIFIEAASEPWHVATGDVDGDGVTDIVSANRDGNHVTVHIGNGDGTFEEPPRFVPTSPRPYDVDLGDLDGDGDLDMVITCNNNGGPVEIRYNDGAGGFDDLVQLFPSGGDQEPFNSTLADLDADSRLDIAIVNSDSRNISVMLNGGNRDFDLVSRAGLGDDPKPIVSGKINDDDHLDLVVANYNDASIAVLLGDGEGNFTQRGTFPAGVLPREITLMDLNGDDLDDVVVAGGRGTDFVVSYLATPDGSLTSPVNIATGPRPNSVDHGDFDEDGNVDVIVCNWSLDEPALASMSLLLGDGTGAFSEVRDFTPPPGFRKFTALAVGHFNTPPRPEGFKFRRGDVDLNEKVNVSDVIHLLRGLFRGWVLPCIDAADTDDSGVLDITDSVYLLEYVFLNGPVPPDPFRELGVDPTEDFLPCDPPDPPDEG